MPGTLVLDFDSTLFPGESLDEMLRELLADRPDDAARVRELTDLGMAGALDFATAMEQRLALARPTRAQVEDYARRAVARLTPGMADVVRAAGFEPWLVTGALEETVLPSAAALGIPGERVLATRAAWGPDGRLAGLVECGSKVDAARRRGVAWASPSVAVGDGMTDYALHESGLVDHFIAYTEHARRPALVATGAPEAANVERLQYLLAGLA